MELVELSDKDKLEYNHFVANAESGSFLQSWDWGEWQRQLGRQAFRFWILGNEGERIASVQLIRMSLPFGKHYLYAPYGPIVDSRFKIQALEFLFLALKEKFTDAIFLRIEPKFLLPTTHHLQLTKSANVQPAKTLLIDLQKSEGDLLQQMHPKTRYNIKLAQKHGVEIKDEFDISIGHGLFAKEAVELLVQTAKRQGYKGYGDDYYQNLIDYLGVKNRSDLKLHIYKAVLNRQLLASAVMLDFGKTRTFLFGGSSSNMKNVMAPYLLHWQAIQDAKAAGLTCYDFWGIETSSGEVPGFVRFKLGFGGNPQEYSGAFDIIVNKILYKAYSIFRKVKRLL